MSIEPKQKHQTEKRPKKRLDHRKKTDLENGNPLLDYINAVSKNVAPYHPRGTILDEIDQVFNAKEIQPINKVLSSAAQERNYGKVIYLYKRMTDDDIKETLYTITIIMNAAARVGDGELVEKTWERMKQLGLLANEVTRTTAVKGYFASGKIDKALYTYYCMDNRANVRSINAVLRGLLRLGNHKQIHTFTKHPINVKDVTTKEYMIALYSIESELGLIRPILKESVSDEDVSLTSLINLATLNCLIGDVESADILVKEFEEHSKKLEVNARRSVRLFKKHQVAQLRNRNKFIKTYIKNTIDTPKEQRRKYQFNNSKEVFQLYPRKTEVIQFNTMFNNDNPVNIELCSGYGEWLITRAKDNLNENWVGVELYRDRVYNSWASKTFAGLNNVGCVWGDAIAVLMLCLMPNTVDKIYLNFPEPPKYENSPTNLFTSQMFFQIARVLKLDGEFMLLTDSPVVVSIIEKVFTHTPLLNNKFQSQGRDFFVKKMPQNYGTSYFDQLWKNGKINQDRFFMHIKKIA